MSERKSSVNKKNKSRVGAKVRHLFPSMQRNYNKKADVKQMGLGI